jgi:hypothetical protein
MCGKIGFVSDNNELALIGWEVVKQCDPFSDSLDRFGLCHIENNDANFGATNEHRNKRPIHFLAGGVPEIELHFAAGDADGHRNSGSTYGGFDVGNILVLTRAEDGSLPDGRVPHKDDFPFDRHTASDGKTG